MSPARVLILACFSVLVAAEARAQLFSPGALSKAHAGLEGIGSCKRCHADGAEHDNRTCLECHKEIGVRLEAARGYHRTVKDKTCAGCHREHRGKNASLIAWTPSEQGFDHGQTGWPLAGAHQKVACKTCHETRRIDDDAVKAIVNRQGRVTFLGLSDKCVRCHFDEHRGQEGTNCLRCHNQETFERAPRFNHNDRAFSQFALVGKHAQVKCGKCHEPVVDKKTPKDAWPSPVDDTFLQTRGIPHESCVDCHEDPHAGNHGTECARCHTSEGWQTIREDGIQDRNFHDTHAFQLRGAHRSVACKSCHGPFAGKPAVYKGLRFARCADCHADAHVGQLAPAEKAQRCETCHDVNGFLPVVFDRTMHASTRFPLEGSHGAVACRSCHLPDPALRKQIPAAVKRDFARMGRQPRVSITQLAMPAIVGTAGALADCAACHDDVHAGQFTRAAGEGSGPRVEKKTCGACHAMTSPFSEPSFKHDDSRFPLTGKHVDVPCAACHVRGKVEGAETDVLVYRSLRLDCASCHADEHVGQLVDVADGTSAGIPEGAADCQRCHSTTGFKPARFDHDKQSVFRLEGKHRTMKCVGCHQVVDANGKAIAQYKPVPTECGSCHVDQHKRAFDPYYPQLASTTTAEPRCDGCHKAAGWTPASFAHERTGFALTGKHAHARCASCHGSDVTRPLAPSCQGCHQDPHAMEFGLLCGACHTTDTFRGPAFPVDAHRRTGFPLTGRHAILPCDECHTEKREQAFTRVALDCASCHAKDALGASLVTVDHARPPFAGVSCANCHVPQSFWPARFPQHEPCFPLASGTHAKIQCNECHANLPGARFTGTCKGVPVLCTTCHAHAADIENDRHAKVPGYEFKNVKCAACHRDGG